VLNDLAEAMKALDGKNLALSHRDFPFTRCAFPTVVYQLIGFLLLHHSFKQLIGWLKLGAPSQRR
jgi:hypothetical protein